MIKLFQRINISNTYGNLTTVALAKIMAFNRYAMLPNLVNDTMGKFLNRRIAIPISLCVI